MAAEIVNLRQARKRAARAKNERDAAENRARFGVGRSERARAIAREDELHRALDAARRTDPQKTDG